MREFFVQLGASYLIVTLAATSLAKLRNLRVVSHTLRTEQIIPFRLIPAVSIGVPLAELVLATLLAAGIYARPVGFATASIFLLFSAYRGLQITAYPESTGCACAGIVQEAPFTIPAAIGGVLSCLVQAWIAVSLALSSGKPPEEDLLRLAAWLLPFAVMGVGLIRRRMPPGGHLIET
jgi:hypothetical protein